MKLPLLITLLFSPFSILAQLAVTVSPPKIEANRAVVPLVMKNNFTEKVESARAIVFLLDDQGRVIGQSTKWVIGGSSNKPGLPAGGTNAFFFVIQIAKPFTTTDLTSKVTFSRVVLEGGKLADAAKVSVFERLSTSWGDQMGSVLRNTVLAFLESDQGGTLADLRRFLIEPAFREKHLKSVRDPDIVYYWKKGFAQLSGNKSIGPAITRLDTFLAPKPIRYMVSQQVNRLDFRDILDTGKIFLAKLPQGQMGKENAFLLGSLLVAKFQQLAMGRQAQKETTRKDFWLYIDEFQNFITPSMTEILTGARKYRLGLILAHQELRQLERDREVASAVLSNHAPPADICQVAHY
jgi:hypothetical protein